LIVGRGPSAARFNDDRLGDRLYLLGAGVVASFFLGFWLLEPGLVLEKDFTRHFLWSPFILG